MTRPRSELIDRDIGGFYHIVSRCVRRARLTGKDPTTGKDFSHRRCWIEARLLALTNVFAVDVLGYAVMSNHYHIVIHYRPRAGKQLPDKDVARRWLTVFPPKPGDDLDESIDTLAENTERISVLRERLSDLSWYMRCLNAPIARRSNIEDECTGRFWEGRFHSKALPDERAVHACMAYVDLNPLRAGDTDRIDAATHTSLARRQEEASAKPELLEKAMAPITFDLDDGQIKSRGQTVLALSLKKYLAHVQWVAERTRQSHAPKEAEQRLLPAEPNEPNAWLSYFSKLRRRTQSHASLPRGMLAFTS